MEAERAGVVGRWLGAGVSRAGCACPAAGWMHIYRFEWQDRLLAELSATEQQPAAERKSPAAEPGSRAGKQRGEELSLPGRCGESEDAGDSDGKWRSRTHAGRFTFSISRR